MSSIFSCVCCNKTVVQTLPRGATAIEAAPARNAMPESAILAMDPVGRAQVNLSAPGAPRAPLRTLKRPSADAIDPAHRPRPGFQPEPERTVRVSAAVRRTPLIRVPYEKEPSRIESVSRLAVDISVSDQKEPSSESPKSEREKPLKKPTVAPQSSSMGVPALELPPDAVLTEQVKVTFAERRIYRDDSLDVGPMSGLLQAAMASSAGVKNKVEANMSLSLKLSLSEDLKLD